MLWLCCIMATRSHFILAVTTMGAYRCHERVGIIFLFLSGKVQRLIFIITATICRFGIAWRIGGCGTHSQEAGHEPVHWSIEIMAATLFMELATWHKHIPWFLMPLTIVWRSSTLPALSSLVGTTIFAPFFIWHDARQGQGLTWSNIRMRNRVRFYNACSHVTTTGTESYLPACPSLSSAYIPYWHTFSSKGSVMR